MAKPDHRLPQGGRINRDKPLSFSYDGAVYRGYEGDTLASALLANGKRLLGRSFKYHRPRGALSAGVEECNALVRLESGGYVEPNARATLVPLYQGLSAKSQNCWPSVDWDIQAINGLAARFLPVGFYNKTFMWPSWRFWEGFVRRAAGLGEAPEAADAQEYHKRHAHCDVLVIGAGPAGLMAALQAAGSGARVILADEQDEMGGSLLWEQDEIAGIAAAEWVRSALGELAAQNNVTLLKRCTATGYYDHNLIVMAERVSDFLGPKAPVDVPRQRLWKVRAAQVVLATGAIERPLVFPNNDRPGVMLAAAVRQYLNRYAVAVGQRVVVACNNDSAYRTALDLQAAGVEVVAVVDVRADSQGSWVNQARSAGIRILNNHAVTDTKGRKGVTAARVAPYSGETPGASRWLDCDLVAMSGGWNPVVHLYSQSGGDLDYVEADGVFVPQGRDYIQTAGSVNGRWLLAECLREGAGAGVKAAQTAGFEAAAPAPENASADTLKQGSTLPVWKLVDESSDKQWIDFQHDVTLSDVELAARENFISVEHFKRFTTTGMSVDQGKTSNINGLATLAQVLGKAIPQVGATKFRPPYTPVAMGALAGPDLGPFYRPKREMPCHDWHAAQQGDFDDAGYWQRPSCYPLAGETRQQAIKREALMVRRGVGLFEGSPLGKIEVRGKDAAEFLNRIYMNNVPSLKQGHIRYALALNDAGAITDDGVFTRLGEDHYLLSPSSAAAERFVGSLEEWHQTAWPHYEVIISPVTTQWATLTLAGPKARQVLQKLDSAIDFSKVAFPHMAFRSGALEGVPARISRVSFTGELSYEVNVPASYAEALWRRLLQAGEPEGIAACGLEALIILRLEKGYLHIGADTDGNTIPDDIGWGAPARKKAVDYVGRRSLDLPVYCQGRRLQLVGFKLLDGRGEQCIEVGAHSIESADTASGMRSTGFVTSSCFSPHLNQPIAIGRIEDGRNRQGEVVELYYDRKTCRAEITAPVFYDPEGERLHA